jgi:hypothetical protein
MAMTEQTQNTISNILKHERKSNSYKIALVRAINDVALEYPHRPPAGGVAIPLKLLAEFWLAYYWVFVDLANPIRQGHNPTDMSFRDELTALRLLWKTTMDDNDPSAGFFLKNAMGMARERTTFAPDLAITYDATVKEIAKAIQQPIKFAGPGQYTVFDKPRKLHDLENVSSIPSAQPTDLCLVISHDLWMTFQELSLWIEALCIHEWCLFTETTESDSRRGITYTLLTARPDNRRPLRWERNQMDILIMEGQVFECPWSRRTLRRTEDYDLDHIIPVAIRPINELWNLVPADPEYNSHVKRDRLPSPETWKAAEPTLERTYAVYVSATGLQDYLLKDAENRFGALDHDRLATDLVAKTGHLVRSISNSRNLPLF